MVCEGLWEDFFLENNQQAYYPFIRGIGKCVHLKYPYFFLHHSFYYWHFIITSIFEAFHFLGCPIFVGSLDIEMWYEKNTQPKIQMLNRLYNVVACYIAPNSILVFCSRSCFFLRSLQVSLNAQGKSVSVCPSPLSETMFWGYSLVLKIPSFHVSPWSFLNLAQCGHLGTSITLQKSENLFL